MRITVGRSGIPFHEWDAYTRSHREFVQDFNEVLKRVHKLGAVAAQKMFTRGIRAARDRFSMARDRLDSVTNVTPEEECRARLVGAIESLAAYKAAVRYHEARVVLRFAKHEGEV